MAAAKIGSNREAAHSSALYLEEVNQRLKGEEDACNLDFKEKADRTEGKEPRLWSK
jgi:hypothetical protein